MHHPKLPKSAIFLLPRCYMLQTRISNPSLSILFPQPSHLNSTPPSLYKRTPFGHYLSLFASICGQGMRCGHLLLRLFPMYSPSSNVKALRFSLASQSFRREPGMRRSFARLKSMSSLSISSLACDPILKPKKLEQIVEVVSRAEDDMELSLNNMNLTLCTSTASHVIRDLSDRGILALRFFHWVFNSCPGINPNSEVYNLIVDNLGRLGEYSTMCSMLTELSRKGHCLTEKSFAFVKLCSSSSIKDSVRRVTEVLNGVRGSCRGSGIFSLIKVLCSMNSFELVLYVMEETIMKTSYYNLLIAAKCGNGDFREALEFLTDMKEHGCIPNTKSYNYLLGSLFKNNMVVEACMLLQKAEEAGCIPDLITYEVITVHACKANRMNNAIEVLNQMFSKGLRPRFTTHAEFIKQFFLSGRVENAYNYVIEMSVKDACSTNMNYSLLAELFRRSGRVVEAGRILYEMMQKGHKPNLPVFIRVLKALHKIGRGDLSSELRSMFTKFTAIIDTGKKSVHG